ncbi:MAG: signal peptide peptidase SppA [Pirellulales bacterium]
MSTYPEPPGPGQPVYIAVPMQQKPGVLSRLFTLFQWLAFVFFVVIMITAMFAPSTLSGDPDNKLEERYYALNQQGTQKIAVIEIEGTIMDGKDVKQQIDKVRKDDAVKALVVRIDSPGGTVTGSDFIYHHLRKLVDERKLPMVVSMGSLAASGGYYSAMACGKQENVIYAEPTTWSGSIGVMIPNYNVSDLMKRLEIKDLTIAKGDLKGMGSPTKPMEPAEEEVLKTLVEESYNRFKGIVRSGRPKMTPKQIDDAATGQIFTTAQALKLGLVDKEGFIEDAIERAIELASMNRDSTKVIRYHKPAGISDLLMGASAAATSRKSELQQLLDLATPRAYYLFALPRE